MAAPLNGVRYYSIVYDSARWEHFSFRDDDIVISTPPKSGTTWTQMICALLIFRTPELPAPLDRLSPWLDMLTRPLDEVVTDLEEQTHRRFIKTHTPRDGLPQDPRVTYIVVGRDPRDVYMSFDNHLANMDLDAVLRARERSVGLDDLARFEPFGPGSRPDELTERYRSWVDDDARVTERTTLRSTLHHLSTWWDGRDEPNVVLVHYSDLKRDLPGEMRRLAARLDIEVPEEVWPELVHAASFDEMRRRADVVAPDTMNAIWHDNRRFFHRGTSGQWRDMLTDADLAHYFTRVDQFATPELSAWLHR